jgi:hypothetical protein
MLFGDNNIGENFEAITGYCAYPDGHYENLLIEAVLLGVEI